MGQSVPPTGGPAAATAASPQPKTRHRKAAPDPAPVQPPAALPTLEQSPPAPPQVTYQSGQLTIVARNATLSQVLRLVQVQTGAAVEMPAGASNERVAGQFGPGQPRDVLNALLTGSKFNYIILGVDSNPGAVQKVILSTPKPVSSVETAQNAAAPPPPEAPQAEENYGEPEPQATPATPTPFRHRPPNMPGRTPDGSNPQPAPSQPTPDNTGDNTQPGAKTPEQLLQELQQMQQQQLQMQQQLNPANRQPQQ